MMNNNTEPLIRWPVLFKESPVFDPKEIRQEEIKYLLKNNYIICHFVPIGETKQRPFLIKTNSIESPQHTFLVWNTTKTLQEYTTNIKTHLTKKPDITFKINKQKHAIEIETGVGYKKHKTRLEQKAQQNNKEYDTNWIILCAKSKMTKQYKKYTKAISRTQLKTYLDQIFKDQLIY